MTFKTTLGALLDKAERIYIDGQTLVNVDQNDMHGPAVRLEITDGDPEFPDACYADLKQEVEINDQGVGTIQVFDGDDIYELEDGVVIPTELSIIECSMHRPIAAEDLNT